MLHFAIYIMQHRSKYAYIHVHITKLLASTLGMLKPFLRLGVISKVSGHYEFSGGILDRKGDHNYGYRIMRYFVRRLDHIHAVSAFTREVLLDCGFKDRQILQIPNAVELKRFHSKRTEANEIVQIGFCGRIEKVKGLDLLIIAIAKIKSHTRQRFHVQIAGDGDYLNTVKSLAEDYGVKEYFTFQGRIKDVPSFLGTLDIYIQPSYAEGLSNSLLEAMSASLPVIASKISGNVDLVENGGTGYLFQSGNSDELAEKLSVLISDEVGRVSMGRQGESKIAQGYSTDVVSDRLIDLYYDAQK